MSILKLSQQFIANNLHCPAGKDRVEYCDTELPGLYVEVRATSPGQGTFYLRFKSHAGKTAHQKIARTTDIDLVEARKRARTLKSTITLGADPSAERKTQRAVLTLSEFFDDHYLPQHAKKHKRSWKRDVQLFSRIKAKFGDTQLTAIRRYDIQAFHGSLEDEGLAKATCDHHVKLIKKMLNLAIRWELLKGDNPAVGVTMFHARNEVEHYMNDEELKRLLDVLRTDDNRAVCRIALFLLSTGARLNEALTAKRQDVNKEARVWRIEALNSKSKRVRSVPLNDSALEVLKELDTEDEFDHLFVNRETKEPYTTIQKVWDRLRKKAGLPQLRIHDLRHQFASFLVNDGRSLYEVQQILGHRNPLISQRYSHLSSKSMQAASNSASAAIKGTMPAAA